MTLTQGYGEGAPAARETQKGPLLIPFAIGLIGKDGTDLPLQLRRRERPRPAPRACSSSRGREQTFTFVDVAEEPLPSLLRNFSAPVIVEYDYTNEQLAFLLAHDSDPFNRWEAGQRLATRELLALAGRAAKGEPLHTRRLRWSPRSRACSTDETLSPAFRELALMLPSEAYLAEQMAESNPAAVHAARQFVRSRLANALSGDWLTVYEAHRTPGAYEADARRRRSSAALKNLALVVPRGTRRSGRGRASRVARSTTRRTT